MAANVERLRGSIVPLVTPFDEQGNIDEPTLRDLIEWQIESGSHGISVSGTTGEPGSLSVEEREYLIEVAVKAARGRVPVVVGTGSTNHQETLRLTRFAEKVGADAASSSFRTTCGRTRRDCTATFAPWPRRCRSRSSSTTFPAARRST